MQSAPTLPINDLHAFVVVVKMLTASSPARGLWSLPFRDKLVFARTMMKAKIADTPAASALSATAVLEQRAFSSRTNGLREVFGLAACRQSRTPPADKQSKRSARRTDSTSERRRHDEFLRPRHSVPRYRQDDPQRQMS